MPTPSPNQPPGPSGHPTLSFSSCPEDMQHPQHAQHPFEQSDSRVPHPAQSTETQRLHSQRDTSSSSTTHAQPALEEEAILLTDQTSIDPSSRATTSSPRPSPNTTGTSPARSVPEDDCAKDTVDGSRRRLDTSIAAPMDLDSNSSGSNTREADATDVNSFGNEYSSPSLGLDYTTLRTMPTSPSSYLRPGSKFHGTQQSERQVYEVQVEIKHVDMRESFLCGYLRIQGLTEDHPTLTTYFEGEIIGSKYGFFTQHEDWGANQKVDLSHWGKFSAFRPLRSQAKRGPVTINDVAQRENIFMRWKEHFLVPDHRVRTITGASFEGFYYICFNQIEGEVSGIYFHSKSEKFQQLELKHVPDRGCFSAMEFR